MPANPRFVQAYYLDLQRQMRSRREHQMRLMQLVLVFDAVLLAAVALAAQSKLPPAMLAVLAIGAAPSMLLVTTFCVERIRRDHAVYEDLGRMCQRIWSYFQLSDAAAYGLNEPILDEMQALRYGKGQGHLRTIMLMRAVSWTLATMVLLLGVAAVLFRV